MSDRRMLVYREAITEHLHTLGYTIENIGEPNYDIDNDVDPGHIFDTFRLGDNTCLSVDYYAPMISMRYWVHFGDLEISSDVINKINLERVLQVSYSKEVSCVYFVMYFNYYEKENFNELMQMFHSSIFSIVEELSQ